MPSTVPADEGHGSQQVLVLATDFIAAQGSEAPNREIKSVPQGVSI